MQVNDSAAHGQAGRAERLLVARDGEAGVGARRGWQRGHREQAVKMVPKDGLGALVVSSQHTAGLQSFYIDRAGALSSPHSSIE